MGDDWPHPHAPQGFGLVVGTRQMEVMARVIPNPRLSYGNLPNFDPKGFGSW